MDIDKIVTGLKRERDRLSRALHRWKEQTHRRLQEEIGSLATPGTRSIRSALFSPEGRKRISEAMKRRRAEHRKKASR